MAADALRHTLIMMKQAIGRATAGATLLLSLCLGGATAAPPPASATRKGRIVFSSNRSGPWRTWMVQADGSGLRQLTHGEDLGHDVDPVFSPAGKEILFSSTRGGTVAVWRMPLDGAKAQRVCDGDQAEWAPDGKRIAFRRNDKLFTRDLATGKETQISPNGWPLCSGPAWSPDGKLIAFACRRDKGNVLFLVPAAGGKPTKVYDKKGACEPHWSPDGTRLVYETETHICTIRPDGTKNRLVTWFGGVQRYARWSPDGTQIVFCQGASERGPWELYVVPARGGSPTRLTRGGSDMHPDWK